MGNKTDPAASRISDCRLLELPKHRNERGNLTVVENEKEIPFDIARLYYLYDIPSGEKRGGHAHRNLYQLLVAVTGSFDVILDDGTGKHTFTLNRPDQGLLVVPGIWRELVNFSSGAICMVIASLPYDEADYLRERPDFLRFKKL